MAGSSSLERSVFGLMPLLLRFFMTEQLRSLHIDQAIGEYTPRAQKVIAHTPMERYREPDELIGPAVWLFSDASSFVTGTVIPVDGEYSSFSV